MGWIDLSASVVLGKLVKNIDISMRWSRFTTFCWAAEVIPVLSLGLALYRGWQQGFSSVVFAVFGVMCVLTLLGIEVGFHRHFSHRSFRAHPAVRSLLAALGSMAFQNSVIWWVGIHRTHHKYTDQPLDPHSPLKGHLHAHSGWLFNKQSCNPPRWSRRIKDLLADPIVQTAHRRYFVYVAAGLVLPAIAVGLITHSWRGAFDGFLWGGLVRVGVVNHLIWSINSICHCWGQRAYNTGDESRNNHWLALPTLGFSLHNNHHAFPNAAVNAHHWWQIDVSGYCILGLRSLGLVWAVNQPSAQRIRKKAVASAHNSLDSLA